MGDPRPLLMGHSIFPGFLLLGIHFWKFKVCLKFEKHGSLSTVSLANISSAVCLTRRCVPTYWLTLLM